MTASPNPKPTAGISSLPNVDSNRSYLPPPQIARNLPSLSKAWVEKKWKEAKNAR